MICICVFEDENLPDVGGTYFVVLQGRRVNRAQHIRKKSCKVATKLYGVTCKNRVIFEVGALGTSNINDLLVGFL
jgi:hypothetical protein